MVKKVTKHSNTTAQANTADAVAAIKAAAAAAKNAPLAQPQGTKYDFTKSHLHIGIPCYGGLVSEPTMTSLIRFILLAQQVGLNWSLDTMVNESLITRGRNNLMAKMMTNKNATHFFFIDADIRFEPDAPLKMMACDKEVIGGLYPKKSLPVSYNINLLPQTKVQGDIFTVDTMATGFLMFKREVYQKLIDAHPETKYVDDVGLGKQYEPMMYSIFDCQIDEKGHYLSEDWLFCRRWQKLGGEIWAHGKVLLNHIGHYEFNGSLDKMPQFGQQLTGALPDALNAAMHQAKITPKEEAKAE